MIFNSPEFALFIILVFVTYWGIVGKSFKLQNLLLFIASYVFYGWWDWRFLSLIAASTIVDYVAAQRIEKSMRQKESKIWLTISVLFNLGLLGTFKYFNFFAKEFAGLMAQIGVELDQLTIDVILPVGISFYTFQTMSYTLDVYYKRMNATNNLLHFATYVAFFPQLVAGPIERAKDLLPQFNQPRVFNLIQAKAGVRLIVWGLFKKVVIADLLAPIVDNIFSNYADASGVTLLLGAFFFAFQIYGDFSGYSDIAIGSAKLFGFELMSNFKFPYFSRDISEFWRRWHISLSTWFRDYLYIPLGGSRVNKWTSVRNVFIIFLVSGFWHGANWTFIAWGGLHALMFLPLLLSNSNRKHVNSDLEASELFSMQLIKMLGTFLLVSIAWVFFRAESMTHALNYLLAFRFTWSSQYIGYLFFPVILILLEWVIRKDERLESINLGRLEIPILSFLFVLVILFREEASEFIYFQF
jgi:alginate O-acetyltransferase complex protein AlgI